MNVDEYSFVSLLIRQMDLDDMDSLTEIRSEIIERTQQVINEVSTIGIYKSNFKK